MAMDTGISDLAWNAWGMSSAEPTPTQHGLLYDHCSPAYGTRRSKSTGPAQRATPMAPQKGDDGKG